MKEIVIQTDKLTKSFGTTRAVDNVTINVSKGEIYGFLGLNGAGKTTTFRLLLKMIGTDSGSFSLLNKGSRFDSSVWNKVGYMVESLYSYPNLSVVENKKALEILSGLSYHVKDSSPLRIELDDEIAIKQPERIAEVLVNNGVPPKEIYIQKENLEDFFLRMIQENSE